MGRLYYKSSDINEVEKTKGNTKYLVNYKIAMIKLLLRTVKQLFSMLHLKKRKFHQIFVRDKFRNTDRNHFSVSCKSQTK